MAECVRSIGEKFDGFYEFFRVLQGQKNLRELGKCENVLDMVRFFYRLSVKKTKVKYGMTAKGLYQSDVYALLTILEKLGQELIPQYNLVFVDEGQDISASEYALLKKINKSAAFNVYGDLKQNITTWRGVKDWRETGVEGEIYTLNQNYRNTNQIVSFVTERVDADMEAIGFDGKPVISIGQREAVSFFKDKKGTRAVIALPEELPALKRSAYNVVSETGVLSKKKVNLMSVYESKGLEFSCVAVYDKGMSENEKYIAYTRALGELAIVTDGKKK
ncbi:MAG: UvrD-helicase domain-containing protein [Clostridia bacterium]|nr:UvrD-helicase domain-containing protein [Clostridia bacterium]